MTDTPLLGQRILIAEDNALIAIAFHDILKRAGAEVIGPVGSVQEAEDMARTENLTGALLDIRLHAEEIWSAASILVSRGVPFMFCTGHFDQNTLPADWACHPVLVKPARPANIIDQLVKLVGAGV